MSTSTDAVIFYGYCWEDEETLIPSNDGDDGDWDEWHEIVAKRRGVTGDWKAQFDAGQAIKQEFAVDIDHHGSDGWRVPYVYAVDSLQRAYRGDAHIIDPGSMEYAEIDVWNERLVKFVEELGIDTTGAKGPAWFLVSWWG